MGDEARNNLLCTGGCEFGRDECIYSLRYAHYTAEDRCGKQHIFSFGRDECIYSLRYAHYTAEDRCGKQHIFSFGRDECIYSLRYAHYIYEVLKIDVVNNTYSLIGNLGVLFFDSGNYWGDAVLGNDGCIYWPPWEISRTLKFDPETQSISLVGDDFGGLKLKWLYGAVASDGAIYCLPFCSEPGSIHF